MVLPCKGVGQSGSDDMAYPWCGWTPGVRRREANLWASRRGLPGAPCLASQRRRARARCRAVRVAAGIRLVPAAPHMALRPHPSAAVVAEEPAQTDGRQGSGVGTATASRGGVQRSARSRRAGSNLPTAVVRVAAGLTAGLKTRHMRVHLGNRTCYQPGDHSFTSAPHACRVPCHAARLFPHWAAGSGALAAGPLRPGRLGGAAAPSVGCRPRVHPAASPRHRGMQPGERGGRVGRLRGSSTTGESRPLTGTALS